MRNQIRIVAAALCAGLLLGAVTTASAASVGVSFAGRDPGFALSEVEVAGVIAQPFWNNIPGEPFSGTSLPLLANAGEFTDVKLVYAANDSWKSDGPSVTPNDKLMKGIIKMNPDPDTAPNPGTDVMSFTITNLPAGTFNVLVYLANNGLGGEVSVTDGTTTYYVSQQAVFNGTFVRATDTLGLYPFGANYAQFDAVATVGGVITVTVVKNIVTPQVSDGGGVAGIQLVQLTGSPLPGNTLACAITNQPTSVTNVEPLAATFSVGTTGPARFQWQKNGVDIPGAVSPSYTTPPTALADSGATFRAIVFNNINTNTSTAATLTVVTNTVAVAITAQPASALVVETNRATFTVAATGGTGNGTPRFQWQKNTVDIPGATNASYTTPPTVLADNGALFRAVVANNINTLTSSSAVLTVVAYTPPVQIQGFLTIDRWDNIGGNTGATGQADLKAAIAAGPPTTTFYVAGATLNDQGIDNFGAKMSGWFVPTVSGDYDFFIRSDDSSALYLNPINNGSGLNALPDFTDPLTAICYENGCCAAFPEPGLGATQVTAAPIPLVAGRAYGMVALLKEGTGGDNLHVAWRLTTDLTPAAQLQDIPPANCAISASTAGQTVAIISPSSVATREATRATFTVSANTSPTANAWGVATWLKNGVPIPGTVGLNSYIIPSVTLAQSGEKYQARLYTLIGQTNSAEATLTVIPDTFPPVATAGAITAFGGQIQVGVTFDEAVNQAGLVAGNFTLSSGAGTFTLVTNSLNSYGGVVLNTTGLVPGGNYTVTVKNVADLKGNAITTTNVPFTVGKYGWADTGTPNRPGAVIPVGADGFDILNAGRAEWGTYDEVTMAYVATTNDFDIKVQVISAEPSSRWARVGLHARNTLDVGAPRDQTLSAYAQTHVNPNQTLGSSGVWSATDPIQPDAANIASNNGFEQNQRNDTGAATTGWGSISAAGNPAYPNVWLRLKRAGAVIEGFRSADGVAWTSQGTVTLLAQQAEMYVGAMYAAEAGNIWGANFDVWGPFDPIYIRAYLGQFRNFGNVSVPVPPANLTVGKSGANVVISWTAGVLQSSPSLTTPAWNDVAGATSPFSTPATGAPTWYRLRGTQ